MKQTIHRVVYNTETACPLASWASGESGEEQCAEALYRTRSGKYFVHGAGGSASAYEGGEQIIPLDEADVRAWLANRLPDEDAAALLCGEKSPMELIGIRIRELRTRRGISQQELAEWLRTPQANVSKWEAGKTDLRVSTLFEIAKALGVPPGELLGKR